MRLHCESTNKVDQTLSPVGKLAEHDLSVVGITDIQLAQESRPALTTVAVPTVEAAELAVSLLRELIETSPRGVRAAAKAPRVCIASAPKLVVRGSTQAPRPERN